MQLKIALTVICCGLPLVILQGPSADAKSRNLITVYSPAVFNIAVLRNRQKPVVVFFASEKCTLCQRLLGRLEAKAEDEFSEDLYLARADMDKLPDLMESLGVSQTPTTRVYINGIMTEEIRGLKMPVILETLERVALTSRISRKFKTRYQG